MTEVLPGIRLVLPLRDNFFCDGPYYLLTSSSLGGVSPVDMAGKVSSGDSAEIEDLLRQGTCIPVAFPGDCAMDRALIVVGDLTDEEENEWIGRLSWKLNVPCGNFIITCGGGDPADLEGAISGDGMSGFCDYFQKIELAPGSYQADIYAFVASITGNFFFESDSPMQDWQDWYRETREGEELPPWLETFDQYTMPGELEELVSYVIRLSPLRSEPTNLPPLDEEMGWCGFEMRRPELCPRGIRRADLTVGKR